MFGPIITMAPRNTSIIIVEGVLKKTCMPGVQLFVYICIPNPVSSREHHGKTKYTLHDRNTLQPPKHLRTKGTSRFGK